MTFIDFAVQSRDNTFIDMAKSSTDIKSLITKLDRDRVGLSIASLPDQIEHVFREFRSKKIRLPRRQWTSVVFCGMGGSALGADLLRAVYEPWLTVPLHIVHGYHLPSYADKDTLVIICSYSGTTEEMLSCLREARRKKLTAIIIASGGQLARDARKHRIPSFIFDPAYNPSGQPRIGTGYTIACLYLILRQTILRGGRSEDLFHAARHSAIDVGQPLALARQTLGRSFIIVSAGHLTGNGHILSNQLNETAKIFAPHFKLPELNHHLLEGLGSLKKHAGVWAALFLESSLYDPQIQKRLRVTKSVFQKQGIRALSIRVSGTRLEQALKMLMYSSWFSYYQGILLGFDPARIPWVDYFKQQMKR